MPAKVWLIPEGSTPYDDALPWKRQLDVIRDENPFKALRLAKERGVIVEAFWGLDDLWIAGYDMADALSEALASAGAAEVRFEVCWESCFMAYGDWTWQGSLRRALETVLALEPGVGADAFITEL